MNFGSPIVFSEDSQQRRFVPLSGISARRDDPNAFNENLLQELIDATPNVLPVREYLPSTTALFSLGREVPVDLGANNGYIDNLLVTNDGYLVIVETKLYRNPEGIREVIAQTLQYGMAIGQMTIMELEARIKRGQSPALTRNENIRDCVSRQDAEQDRPAVLADDFDEALERHLRHGEVLLLIVSDGIHVGVERVTHWLNEQGNSSPFKFGMVELKFFTHGNERLVVPRTVLKTREVSRHVVVVDIRPTPQATATTAITDDFRNTAGGKIQESRSVRPAALPLTRSDLLRSVDAEDKAFTAELLGALEAYPLDFRGLPTTLQVGFYYPEGSDVFHPLAHLYKGGVWAYPLAALRKVLGPDATLAFHSEANSLATFFREDQIGNPDSTGGQARYGQLAGKAEKFAAFLNDYRNKALERLETNGPN